MPPSLNVLLLPRRLSPVTYLSKQAYRAHTAAPNDARTSHAPRYRWQEDVENLEYYRHGGFHPIKLCQIYGDAEYQIWHKLGYGNNSTV